MTNSIRPDVTGEPVGERRSLDLRRRGTQRAEERYKAATGHVRWLEAEWLEGHAREAGRPARRWRAVQESEPS